MNNRLALAMVALLTGCCSEDNKSDCTQEQLARFEAEKQPKLVTQKDGVNLYWVRPCWECRGVFFTTPCGDTQWETTEMYGKVPVTKQHSIKGVGCQP